MFKKPPYFDENGNVVLELDLVPSAALTEFFSSYEIIDMIPHPMKKPPLKKPKDRVCRFCGKQMPEVTFIKDAHTIPQLLGNRHLVSDFECDTCNQKFSLYEDNLAALLGVSRTLTGLSGQRGIPTFKTPDKLFKAAPDVTGKKVTITTSGFGKKYWKVNKRAKTLKLFSIRGGYTPLLVYKSLLKMLLCYIPEHELPHLDLAINALQGDSRDELLSKLNLPRASIQYYAGPPRKHPALHLMGRKEQPKVPNVPKYVAVLYFGNYIAQFPIALYRPDIELFRKSGEFKLLFCPPFLSHAFLRKFPLKQAQALNLTGRDKRNKERHEVTLRFESAKFFSTNTHILKNHNFVNRLKKFH